MDILVGQLPPALYTPTQLYSMLGNGDGTFQSPVLIDLPGFSQLAVGDFNDDGSWTS